MKAICKHWFRITQVDIDIVQEKDIHTIFPCPVLKRGVYGFEKRQIDVDLFLLELFPSHYIDFLFIDGHNTDTVKLEKVKVQNSVESKYKFYKKQCWRYLRLGEASVGQQNWTAGIPLKRRTAGSTPSHHFYFVMWLWQIPVSQILIHSDVQTSS